MKAQLTNSFGGRSSRGPPCR